MESEYDIDENTIEFCKGMSMTVSTSGFQSALFSRKRSDCITLLFPSFKLDNTQKFAFAMISTFLLAVTTEGIACFHAYIRHSPFQNKRRRRHKIIMTLFYGVRQCLLWLLMLISMTFCIELFSCVILGIFMGKALFPPELSYSLDHCSHQTRDRQEHFGSIVNGIESSKSVTEFGQDNNGVAFIEDTSKSANSGNNSSTNAFRRRRR